MQDDAIYRVLREKFGISSFRGAQLKVIQRVLEAKNSLVVMPTGYGKSLCYQLPSFLLNNLVLVISPLIALMKDQVDAARKTGLNCCFINSSISKNERHHRYKKLHNKAYNLIYVTPERFRKDDFCTSLMANEIALLAVDEAHCISQWGHDFRPDYDRLGEIRKRLKDPPTIALTATATPEVQADILQQLNLQDDTTKVFLDGFERPNLDIQVAEVVGDDDKIRCISGLRHQYPGTTIIYFFIDFYATKVFYSTG